MREWAEARQAQRAGGSGSDVERSVLGGAGLMTVPKGFDVLVVGGGVAGCVLAARLSEDRDRRVALVEAGPDYGPDHGAWPTQVRDARVLPRDDVWEPGGTHHRIRAKLLGGSSCINGCWHTWGSERDFAEWASFGGDRWSASALEPYRRTAAQLMRLRPVPESELSVWSESALVAAADLGYPHVADMAAPSVGPGSGCPPVNAVGELRWNVAWAYLDPARERSNLQVFAGAAATRLLVRAGTVQGVAVGDEVLVADSYVLSAGTYGSPSLLLRSGIGPGSDLARLGIDVEIDLPGVGANLVDHPCLVLPLTPTPELNASLAAKEAAGDLFASQVAIKAASDDCPEGSWDLHLLPTAGAPLYGSLPPGQYEVGIAAFLMKPRSRGVLSLTSVDPDEPARIDPALLHDDRDLATGRAALRLAAELAEHPALKAWATPAGRSDPAEIPDAELRANAGSYWHPVGTCRMGDDPMAVVGPSGRVHGLSNLHVVDASILPTVPAANTQLPVLAVAEMLARELG